MMAIDLKAILKPLFSSIETAPVSGAAINGETIATTGYDAIMVVVGYDATLTGDLDIEVELETSSDGTTWEAYAVPFYEAVEETITATGTGVVVLSCEVGGAKKYIRPVVTPTKAVGGDTVLLTILAVMGGAQKLPV